MIFFILYIQMAQSWIQEMESDFTQKHLQVSENLGDYATEFQTVIFAQKRFSIEKCQY